MAKPLVKVVNETLVDDFGKKHLVLQPDCMYALTYDGKAVVIKTVSELDNNPKYQRTAFAQQGSVELQAKKLNKIFNTDLFGFKII
jgi:hypothetical protein